MSRIAPTRLVDMVNSTDRSGFESLIAEVSVGHFGFVTDGLPVVMPIAIALGAAGEGHVDRDILLHGSTGSWWLRRLATGIPVSLAVTAVDGIVVARSAFESSMHYRSAVAFGTCTVVPAEEKVAVLDAITEALIPGRVAEVRDHTTRELAATLVLRMTVDEWSLKVSDGWPEDAVPDVAGSAWAGVVPFTTRREQPLAAPDLRGDIPIPPSVQRLITE